LISCALSPGSPSLLFPSPSSPCSLILRIRRSQYGTPSQPLPHRRQFQLKAWNRPGYPQVSMVRQYLALPEVYKEANSYPDPQMNLDFATAEFFDGQNERVAPNLSTSSSSIAPSPSTSFEISKLSHPEYAGTPGTLPDLTSTEQLFDRSESFILLTNDTAPARITLNPSILLAHEWIQPSAAHSPTNFLSGAGSSFVMTCPLPLCSHQSTEVISIWRHITWDHLGDKNRCSKAIAELVERVVLGAGE